MGQRRSSADTWAALTPQGQAREGGAGPWEDMGPRAPSSTAQTGWTRQRAGSQPGGPTGGGGRNCKPEP